MPTESAERDKLEFSHVRWAFAALVAFACLLGGLGWWNDARQAQRGEAWRARLCKELPAGIVQAIDSIQGDMTTASLEVRSATAMLSELAEEPEESLVRGRVLFESPTGLREIHRWQDQLGVPADQAALAASPGACEVRVEDERTRLVRRLGNRNGVNVLLVLEMMHR